MLVGSTPPTFSEAMSEDLRTVVRDYLIAEFQPDDPEAIDENTQLVEEDVLDSIGIFSTVSFLEERFAIEIPADEVVIENFETLSAIEQLVSRVKGG
jgi:acyl carrier protein